MWNALPLLQTALLTETTAVIKLSVMDRFHAARKNCDWRSFSGTPLFPCLIVLMSPLFLPAQEDSQGFTQTTLLIQNARVIIEPGKVIENASILIRDRKIVAVNTNLAVPPDADVLDARGLTVVAGLIDGASSTLIDPAAKLPDSSHRVIDHSRTPLISRPEDQHEGLTPQFDTSEALLRDGKTLDRFRSAGVTVVHAVPTGRIASGQSSVLVLSGAPERQSLVRPQAMHLFRIWEKGGNTYPSTMMGVFAHLRQTFLDAEHARQQQALFDSGTSSQNRPPFDSVWETFSRLRQDKKVTLWEVDSRDDVDRALRFALEHQLLPKLWLPQELPDDLQFLKQHKVDVLISLNFGEEPAAPKPDSDLPFARRPEPPEILQWKIKRWKSRIELASRLHQAGIRFAISTQGLANPADLWSSLRLLISHGLPVDAALAACTTAPAEILEIDREYGRVVAGNVANLTLLSGPFEHPESKVRFVFIQGQRFEFHKDAKPVTTPVSSTAPQVDLTGTWTVEIDAGEQTFPATFELTRAAQGMSGRFLSGQGDGLVSRSGLQGDKTLELDVSIGAGAGAVLLKFTGTLQTDEWKGTVKSPFAPAAQFVARRQKTIPVENLIALETVEGEDPEDQASQPVSALDATSPAGPVHTRTSSRPIETPLSRRHRGPVNQGNVLVRGGNVLTGAGPVLEATSLLVRQGKIVAIGHDLQADEGMAVIDATGLFVMPGIIDTHSHIMISNGLGGVNEATDSIVCEVRIQDVVNSADADEFRALAGGVTTARLLHGSANVIGGQDAVVQLKHGTSSAEHLFPHALSGVKFALGENVKFRRGRFPNTRLGVEATLQRAMIEALEYRREWQEFEARKKTQPAGAPAEQEPRRDLRLEALAAILSGEKQIHSHCYRSDEILMLLRVAEQHGIRIRSLQHVLEGYKVAPEIVSHGASCSTFADWWAYKVEAYDAVPQNAALLHAAGANVVIKSDNEELIRHLNQEAAKSVRYGNVDPQEALNFITRNAARELGIADHVGTLEVGKQADMALFNAHPLNTFARCEMTLIAGEPYFVRKQHATAMTEQGQARSTTPGPLVLSTPAERRPWIDWSSVTGRSFVLTGGTLHPVDQPVIPRGTLVCRDGKITQIGTEIAIPEGLPVLAIEGLHVYPGLIDAGTTIGLTEIGKVVETHDYAEGGLFQPDLRAGVGVNPDSELLAVARAGGITTAFVRPVGGILAGQGSLIQLSGWTAPEMVREISVGLELRWPGANNNKEQYEQLKQWWKRARLYDAARSSTGDGALPTETDPRFEAMRPFVRGEKPVFIEAHSEQHLFEALQFAKDESIRLVLCGATDAWKLTEEIRAAKASVIIGPVMRAPQSEFDPYDATYANPGRLYEAGIPFCIRSDNAANSRNAPFEAGHAVAFGLPEEAALRSVTLSAAEILNVANEAGSLTPGKRADLIILDGSPLQVTSQVKGVVVDGTPFRPESRQTRFADKYRQRLPPARLPE